MRGASLALWFLLGLAASVPAAFAYASLRGDSAPTDPEGRPAAAPAARRVMPSPAILARVDAHCEKGYELLQKERNAEAFEEFSEAARLDPYDARPYMGQGEAYRNLDYDELAEVAYRRAVELDPGFWEAKQRLATVLFDFGKHEEAVTLLREMEGERPEDAFVVAELGLNALRLGKPEEAATLFETYNRLAGRQEWGYENLGRAHADAGRTEDAERAYREALAINPRSALAHLWLGQLLRGLGRSEEAEAEYRIFQRLRELQTRARLLAQDLNRSPNHLPTLMALAETRIELGLYREALVPLERALALVPGDRRIRELHAGVKARLAEGD